MKIKHKKLRISLLPVVLTLYLFINCSGTTEEPVIINPPVVETENEWIIYEVNPGLFTKRSVFNEVASRLDDLEELHINVIWLMPVYEQGELKAIGSPYCVKDYNKLNEDYGTMDELRTLVSKAHAKGMKVILDWVANHTSWDNKWIVNKSWYTQDSNGNIVSPPGMNWNDVADLDYANNQMREEMINAMKYWITEAGVDGYRCDYAEGVPGDFWKDAIQALKSIKSDGLLMLAEGGNTNLFSYGFDMVYGWDFAYKLQDLYNGKITVKGLFDTHQKEYLGVPEGKQRMRYITNHDMASEHSPVQAYKGEKGALSAFVIAVTMGGTPMVYSSQEVGYPSALSFFGFREIDWESNLSYFNQYRTIMDIYAASEALRKGELRSYDNTGKVISFLRKSNKERVLIMVNTSDQVQETKIPIEFAHEKGKDLTTQSTETLPSILTLQPFQFKIWKL